MIMKKRILILLAAFILTACSSQNPFLEQNANRTEPPKQIEETTEVVQEIETETITEGGTEEVTEQTEEAVTVDDIDLSLQPNEGGNIMVLMYHNIGEEEEEWVRTPDNFRKDLQTLYDLDYRPIRLSDYVSGNITTPAGKTPYVITFDDGRENNFRYLADGTIDPNCAVGILMEFSEQYQDFEPHATFFINGGTPFENPDQAREKVAFMIENGMDIGNHSYGHEDFTQTSVEAIEESLGFQYNFLQELMPEGYTITSLALPFGSRPDEADQGVLEEGTYEGKTYNHTAILNVGWNPDYSPYHKDFDWRRIHRVRASETNVDGVGMYDWLEDFSANPDKKFVSDGFADIVSVPADWQDSIPPVEGKTMNYYGDQPDSIQEKTEAVEETEATE